MENFTILNFSDYNRLPGEPAAGFAVIELATMKIRIFSNEVEAPLTRFIGNLLGNVCIGITTSLKTPRPIRNLKYEIEGQDVRIEVNREPVPMDLNSGFSKIIVSSTIRGMVRHLKLEDPDGTIRIEVDTEIQS
jgi:hypothetical protein